MSSQKDFKNMKPMKISTEHSSLDSGNTTTTLSYGAISNNTKNFDITSNPINFDNKRSSYHDNNRFISDLPDHLIPEFDSVNRKSSIGVGIFNIIATLIDGTALSVPYAIYKCGLLVGILFLILGYYTTLASCRLIIILSRKLQAASLSEIIDKTLGVNMRRLFSINLALILLCIITGFMILIKEISITIFKYWFDFHAPQYPLLIGIAILCSPLLFQDTLHSLRYSCYCGFCCICFMLCILIIKGVTSSHITFESLMNLRLVPERLTDMLIALPIIKLCFLCQFNMLGVYGNLRDPTNDRIDSTISNALRIISIFFLVLGTIGYLIFAIGMNGYAYDNILEVFPTDDTIILVGRIFMEITLIAALPVIMVPARTIILNEIVDLYAMRSVFNDPNVSHTPTPANIGSPLPGSVENLIFTKGLGLGLSPSPHRTTLRKSQDFWRFNKCPTDDESSIMMNGMDLDMEMDMGSSEAASEAQADWKELKKMTHDMDVGLEGLEPTWQAWKFRNLMNNWNQIPVHDFLSTSTSTGIIERNKGHQYGIPTLHSPYQQQSYLESQSLPEHSPSKLSKFVRFKVPSGTSTNSPISITPLNIDVTISDDESKDDAPMLSSSSNTTPLSYSYPRFSPRIKGSPYVSGNSSVIDSPMPMSYYSPRFWKIGVTLLLTAITIVIAVETPQVSMVWSLAGSSVSLFVGFVMPTISYIMYSHENHLKYDTTQYIAWILLIYSTIVMIACTIHNVNLLVRQGITGVVDNPEHVTIPVVTTSAYMY